MVLYVSSVRFKDSLDDRRILFRNIYLMDARYAYIVLMKCKL
jgi:hypothetical protein